MREKFIDSALLAGMVIICVVILYTLFSPPTQPFGRNRVNPRDEVRIDSPPAEGEPQDALSTDSEAEVPEIASNTPETAEADIVPVVPNDAREGEGSSAEADGGADAVDVETADDNGETPTDVSSGEVEVLPPEDSAQDETGETENQELADAEVAEDSEAEEAVIDSEAEDSEDSAAEEDTEEDAQEALEPPPPVPAGRFELERIGFSFVTGGAGACGVVLEAWQHVAVSRDILERYPCGSEITVLLDDSVDGREELTAVVADTMNPANSRTVNIYVGTDEPALEYGVNTGTLEP